MLNSPKKGTLHFNRKDIKRCEGIKKETCWTISNITAGNAAQLQGVIDANIFPSLLHVAKAGLL